MMRTLLLLFVAVFMLSFVSNPDQSTQYFVQARIVGISSQEESETIDKKIQKKSNVATVNTDHVTGTFFCLLEPGMDVSEVEVRGWFSKLGYEMQCYYKGIQGVDGVLSPHDLKNCQDKKEGE